jgi:hypothetical protein
MRVQPVHDARVFTPMVYVPSKLPIRHANIGLDCFHQFILNEGLPRIVHCCHFVTLTHVLIYVKGALTGNDGVVNFVPPGDTLLVVAPGFSICIGCTSRPNRFLDVVSFQGIIVTVIRF